MSLPRGRNGDGYATDEQWNAVQRWTRQHRRQHRNEDPWDRFNRAEIEDENRRFGKA